MAKQAVVHWDRNTNASCWGCDSGLKIWTNQNRAHRTEENDQDTIGEQPMTRWGRGNTIIKTNTLLKQRPEQNMKENALCSSC